MPISRAGSDFDIILVSAEFWDDHPLSPVGMIARVLDAKGFSVGIIEKPVEDEDFTRVGAPRLFFGVTSGSIDSMLNNYTPLKRPRSQDAHADWNPMPDRALIVYCNALRRLFKGCKIVIGGIEASLRRFAHYDYWDNAVRRSVLFDTRADILVYGNGEKQVIEIAERARGGKSLDCIQGTCVISDELPAGFESLPPFEAVKKDKARFCEMQLAFSNSKDIAQESNGRYLLQHAYPEYTTADLDWLYSLPFSRRLHPESQLGMAQFSVVTHRGCIGECSFCSLALHQGSRIISRSEDGIIHEIERLTKHPQFKGYIDDLGGPSANMYGMDCGERCANPCLECGKLDRSHSRLIALMRRARTVKGVKKVFVRSGVRYDLALESKDYIEELSRFHISGCLKVAPEHFSAKVLGLMNKDGRRFGEFVQVFGKLNEGMGQSLRHYLMLGHPGEDEGTLSALLRKAERIGNIEQFQLFTPTPMTLSTCMYWTGVDPRTMRKVNIIYDYKTKKMMKAALMRAVGKRGRTSPDSITLK
ncbi:MAG: YgiQ family radical SAM protein [Euryarchaeota archaeon]|nr:YgiQ family radical SAM protein [Euryarchaeota archaeon]